MSTRYRVNDKTTFSELADYRLMPRDFGARVQAILGQLGTRREELLDAVERVRALSKEAEELEPALMTIDENSPEWLRMQQRAGIA